MSGKGLRGASVAVERSHRYFSGDAADDTKAQSVDEEGERWDGSL